MMMMVMDLLNVPLTQMVGMVIQVSQVVTTVMMRNDSVYANALEICDGQINTCGGSLPADEIDDDGDVIC